MKNVLHSNILLFLTFALFGLCTNAEESPLQTQFEDQYEKLISQTKKREDSATGLQQLEAIWLSTRKQLIVIDAEIDAKKLDVSVSSGRQQAEAMNELIAMGGARERTLIDGINKLDNIEKSGTVSASQNPVMESTSEGVGISEQKGSGSKFGSVSISIEPEDITNSGLP